MGGPTTTASTRRTADELIRIVLAVACFGAGAIHLVFARTHFDDGGAHGTYFFLLAGAQIAAGVALLIKPTRAFLALAFGVNLLAVVVWGLAQIMAVDTIAEPALSSTLGS